jgi:hypothetical protein
LYRVVVQGFTAGVHSRPGERRYHVALWQQPWHRWAIAACYHHYDMWIMRRRWFQRLDDWHHRRHRGDDLYVPLAARQDIRCYHLMTADRTTLALVEVDQATYEKITGKLPAG